MRKSRLLSDSARLQPCSLLRRATLHSFSSAFFLHVLVTFPFFWPRAALPFFLRERQTAEKPGLIVYCVSGEATQRRLLWSGLG